MPRPTETPQPNGRAYLRPGHTVYLGDGTTSELHAAHSIKIVVALEGSFRVRIGHEPCARVRSIVIGSELPHAVDATGALVATFWIHPEAFAAVGRGRRVAIQGAHPMAGQLEERMRAPLRRHCEQGAQAGELDEVAAAVVRGLRSDAVVTRLDPRITRVVELLARTDASPDHGGIAAVVRLSPTRLTHLFHQETGISLRKYQMWNRGRVAVSRVAMSRVDAAPSLTALAHEAGFADGAHLSRTTRRLLGVTPKQVQRRCRFICDGDAA